MGLKEVWTTLPGFGDTIRMTDHQTILAPLAIARYGKIPSPLDLLGDKPTLRTIFGTVTYIFFSKSRNDKFFLLIFIFYHRYLMCNKFSI